MDGSLVLHVKEVVENLESNVKCAEEEIQEHMTPAIIMTHKNIKNRTL